MSKDKNTECVPPLRDKLVYRNFGKMFGKYVRENIDSIAKQLKLKTGK